MGNCVGHDMFWGAKSNNRIKLLVDTELTLSTATANESRYKWILGLEELIQYTQGYSSATIMKRLSVSKLHNFTLSPHLCEVFIALSIWISITPVL